MKKIIFTSAAVLFTCFSFLAQEDVPNCKDSPMFSRMPNTFIMECSSNYDQMDIALAADKTETMEGTKTFIAYVYNNESAVPAPSFFQILKNYENALLKSGGKRIYYSKEAGVATLFTKSAAGKDIWVVLTDFSGTSAGNFELAILEIESMKQEVASGEMLSALNTRGSVDVYINFETGKSDIKPESQKIIDDIAQMMKENPAIRISIEGHTDNAGNEKSNQTLSENRAKAVMNAVIAKGIDKSRMTSKGWGQTKSIADNGTEDGKARNRRVAIVKV